MTVGFDHLEAGTPEAVWAVDPRLASLPRVSGPGAGTHLLVVAAHPDDETLGAGGLIAAAARRGARVEVIVATNGDRSHPDSPTHTPADLVQIREAEARAAVAALAPAAELTLMGLPDGGLEDHEPDLAAHIAARLTAQTLLLTPWSADQHPDHEACARAGRAAIAEQPVPHWQYPIWAWHWATPGNPDIPWASMSAVDLDSRDEVAKAAAMSCYRSQHEPLSDQPGDEAILPPRLLAHFTRAYETFVIEAGE
jgi:LmbE family N-acetylglucosaminyl deacetylase